MIRHQSYQIKNISCSPWNTKKPWQYYQCAHATLWSNTRLMIKRLKLRIPPQTPRVIKIFEKMFVWAIAAFVVQVCANHKIVRIIQYGNKPQSLEKTGWKYLLPNNGLAYFCHIGEEAFWTPMLWHNKPLGDKMTAFEKCCNS